MAREFKRTDRVGSQLQRELSELIRQELDDPRLGLITIQEVRVVRDFSQAKVFFTVMAGELSSQETANVLNDAAAFLRHELGAKLRLRTVPELQFSHDDSIEAAERLSALIEKAVKSDGEQK